MVSLVDPERSNPKPLNGSQFSQGTLFKPPKPSAEHRWAAHGYSPERREAIREAIPLKNVKVSSKFYEGDVYKATREVGYAGTPADIRKAMKPQRVQTRNAIVDILSRSTAPVEDITRNTPKFRVAPHGAMGTMSARMNRQTGLPEQGQITLSPYHGSRAAAEHTLIHELGHHADFESDPVGFARTARTERMFTRGGPPSLEGAAEGYAAKHQVQRRNDPQKSYSEVASYKDLHSRPSFSHHFERVSGQSLSEAMGHAHPEHMSEQFHQPSLWEGIA